MPDVSPYGVTQNPDAASVTANQLVGSKVESINANAVGSSVSPAGLWSTAPYKPPPSKRGVKGCYANDGECGAPALRGEKYCFWHSKAAK